MSRSAADVAGLLQSIRAVTSMSQSALADQLGVSYPTVNAWENGRHQPRAMHMLQIERLARRQGLLDPPSILVIDRDTTVADTVADLVDGTVDVVAATTAAEGLLICGRMRPDVLVTSDRLANLDVDGLLTALAADDQTAGTHVLLRTDRPDRWDVSVPPVTVVPSDAVVDEVAELAADRLEDAAST